MIRKNNGQGSKAQFLDKKHVYTKLYGKSTYQPERYPF